MKDLKELLREAEQEQLMLASHVSESDGSLVDSSLLVN